MQWKYSVEGSFSIVLELDPTPIKLLISLGGLVRMPSWPGENDWEERTKTEGG